MSKSVWSEPRNGGVVLRWYSQNRRTPSGRPAKEISRLYANQQEADAAAAVLRATLPPTIRARKAGPRRLDYIPLREVAALWAAAHKEGGPGHENYLRQVQLDMDRIAQHMKWSTSIDVTEASVDEYLKEHDGRGRRQLAYVRAVLRWARRKLKQPLDPDAEEALKAPQSNQADVELLRSDEVAMIRKRAAELELTALIECLLVYGWRPVTACRLKIGDVFFDEGRIRIGIKRNKAPFYHRLVDSHIDLLRACAGNRPKEEHLFLNPSGKPWRLSRDDGGAEQLSEFFRSTIYPEGADGPQGGVYQLKRWAITNMNRGGDPWRKSLSPQLIALFTGHKTKGQILRYLQTNDEEARDVMILSEKSNSVGTKWATPCRIAPDAAHPSSHNVIQFPGLAEHEKLLPPS